MGSQASGPEYRRYFVVSFTRAQSIFAMGDSAFGGHPVAPLLTRFWNEQLGATAIEYVLIADGISVVIIAAVNTLGGNLVTTFTNVSTQLK